MALRLTPQKREFFDLSNEAALNAREISRLLVELLEGWPASRPLLLDIRAAEHEGDRLTHEVIDLLNRTFVTPFDREDLVTLAFAVDEAPDKIESATELLGLYGVEAPTRHSIRLCGLLVQATEELAALLGRLRDLRGSADEIRRIKAIEDEADTVARAARASLFKDDRIDPVLVIRWKGIYEALEDAVDACDTAASRVGNMLVENA